MKHRCIISRAQATDAVRHLYKTGKITKIDFNRYCMYRSTGDYYSSQKLLKALGFRIYFRVSLNCYSIYQINARTDLFANLNSIW